MHKSEIEIPKPCDEPWDAMSGCGVKRHCARCDQSVYDLSALSEAEARALLANPPAKLCVSYLLDEQGVIVLRRKPSKSLAIGLALSVAACSNPVRVSGDPLVTHRTAGTPIPTATASATPTEVGAAASVAPTAPLPASVPSSSASARTQSTKPQRRSGAARVVPIK